MGKFRQQEIEDFEQQYRDRLKEINRLLTNKNADIEFGELRPTIEESKEHIVQVITNLEKLKKKQKIFSHNDDFKDSEADSDQLNQYFTNGLIKIDEIIKHAGNTQISRGQHPLTYFAFLPEWLAIEVGVTVFIIAACVLGQIAVAWITIPILFILGSIIYTAYMVYNNSKVAKQLKEEDIKDAKSSIEEVENHFSTENLKKVDEWLKNIEAIVNNKVKFDDSDNNLDLSFSYPLFSKLLNVSPEITQRVHTTPTYDKY